MTRPRARFFFCSSALCLLAVACLACSKPPASDPASGGKTVKMSGEARTKWASLCVSCHGNEGKGDGPAAAQLNPKPRAFADVDWLGGVDDDYLRKIIVKGGAAVNKSPTMPPSPDLEGKPELVDDLIRKVRSYAP